MVNIIVAIIIGYLLGSIPSAYLAGRLRKGVDIREVGSKNMGAMNVYYEVGLMEAVLVTIADLGKGIGAVLIARWLDVSLTFQLIAGLAAVIGHVFPVFLKFRGGKGGATAIGILCFFMPKAIPFIVVVFAISLLATRNPTFSYSLLLVVFPFVAGFIYVDRYGSPLALVFYSIGLGVFLGIQYIPRLKEMHDKAGDWRKVIRRRSFKDRL